MNQELFDRLINIQRWMCSSAFERIKRISRSPDIRKINTPPERQAYFDREEVLRLLAGNIAAMRQGVIAEKMAMDNVYLSSLIDRLAKDGYVLRTADPADKNGALIVLTKAGRNRAKDIEAERPALLEAMFSKLTDDEKRTLLGLLERMTR